MNEPSTEAVMEISEDKQNLPLCPWEDFEQYGFFKSLLVTLVNVLAQPVTFFKSLNSDISPLRPLFFGVCIASIGNLALGFYTAFS